MSWKCCLPPVCTDTKDPEKAKGGCAAFTHHTESKHRRGSPLVNKDSIQEDRHYLLGIALVLESKSLTSSCYSERRSFLTKDISIFYLMFERP